MIIKLPPLLSSMNLEVSLKLDVDVNDDPELLIKFESNYVVQFSLPLYRHLPSSCSLNIYV